jgi:NADH-quinone oxidoreductase subunit M
MVLIGVWHSYPTLTILVGLGIVAGVAYIWRAMQAAFFADSGSSARSKAAEPDATLPPNAAPSPISLPERLGAVLLIGASVVIGLYPQLLLNIVTPALDSPLFEGLRQGRWR